MKNEYIFVEVLFDREDDDNTKVNYEDLGIKAPKETSREFEVVNRIIFTDKIVGFGPSNLVDVVDLHMVDGYSFRAKGTIDSILYLIYGDNFNKTDSSLSEDDFII